MTAFEEVYSAPMKPKHWDSAARYRRTERRRSTAMFIIGTLFTITGVLIVKLVQRSRADQTRPGKAGGDEIL